MIRVVRAVATLAAAFVFVGPVPASRSQRDAPALPVGPVLLRVDAMVSLAPPKYLVRVPQATLYRDGRLIVPTGTRDTALIEARQVQLTGREVTAIYRRAYSTGLYKRREVFRTDLLDAGGYTITLTTPGGPVTSYVTVPASFKGWDLVDFVERLPDPSSPGVPYQPATIAAVRIGSAGSVGAARDWPADLPPPATRGACTLYSGADAARVAALARSASADTSWRVGEDRVVFAFRPLLPGDPGCP